MKSTASALTLTMMAGYHMNTFSEILIEIIITINKISLSFSLLLSFSQLSTSSAPGAPQTMARPVNTVIYIFIKLGTFGRRDQPLWMSECPPRNGTSMMGIVNLGKAKSSALKGRKNNYCFMKRSENYRQERRAFLRATEVQPKNRNRRGRWPETEEC